MFSRPALAALLAGLILCVSAQAAETLALNGLDPVELVRGREVRGLPNFSMSYGNFRYQFANWENLERFEWNPGKYEVQYGGSCARMGPFSGACDSSNYAVHDGRIYTFASQQCRDAFVKEPQAYLLKPDPEPTGDSASAAAGKALVDKAVAGFGGAEALAQLRTYSQTVRRTWTNDDGSLYSGVNSRYTKFPETFREEESWGDDGAPTAVRQVRIIDGDHGFLPGPDGRALAQAEINEMRNGIFHDPLFMVKGRHRDDFKAFAAGSGTVDGTAVQYVNTYAGGIALKLGIDPTSGHVLSATFRGRMSSGRIGEITHTYSDFRTLDGLTVPFAMTVSEDGKVLASPSTRVESVQVNPPQMPNATSAG